MRSAAAPGPQRVCLHSEADRGAHTSEFTVVTDVEITTESERHNFVLESLQDASIVPVPLSGFATGVAKLKPMLQ